MTAGEPAGTAARPRWVLLVRDGSEANLSDAAAMTAAAVSLGVDVTVVWFGAALAALAAGQLDARAEEEESAGRLLREARRGGRVRYLACSASAVRTADGVAAVRSKVDEIVGWPTAVSLIRAAERAFVW